MPGDARASANEVLSDVTYDGKDVQKMAKAARDSVGGGASGVEFTAAPRVTPLVENLHTGLSTNAQDLVTLRAAMDDVARADPKSVQAKVANAYGSKIDDLLSNTNPATSGYTGTKLTDPPAARSQVGAARQIMDATEPGGAAEPWWKQQGWVTPASALTGSALASGAHILAHQPGLTGVVGAGTLAAPYVASGAKQIWNAADRLTAPRIPYNVLTTGSRAAPVAQNALLNLMLSRMTAQ
jgi:hypothetical protein